MAIPDYLADVRARRSAQAADRLRQITKRRGRIDNISMTHNTDGTKAVNYWRVLFEDGKQPLYGIFKDQSEINLLK